MRFYFVVTVFLGPTLQFLSCYLFSLSSHDSVRLTQFRDEGKRCDPENAEVVNVRWLDRGSLIDQDRS